MRIIDGKIILGRKNCSCTMNFDETKWGKSTRTIPCPDCKGTGNGKRGGFMGCKRCYGMRTTWTWDNPQVCSQCNGNWKDAEQENSCDRITQSDWESLEFRVYRHNRLLSGNETLLGFGCVYSLTDYGDEWKRGASHDAELINEVKGEKFIQATKIAKNVDGELIVCNHVGIFVCPGGYSVRAVFELPTTLATIALERPEREYMAVGTAMANEGRNGTIEAIYREVGGEA